MQFTMSGPERSDRDPSYRPLMGIAPRTDARPLLAACPDAELPSLRGFLWAVVWVVVTVLIVAQYALEA